MTGRRLALQLVAAVWVLATARAAAGPDIRVEVGLDGKKAQSVFSDMTGQGWRYVQVDSAMADDGMVYAMVFAHEAAPAYVARSGLDLAAYQAANDEAVAGGMRPVDVSVAEGGDGGVFSGIWEKAGGTAWVAKQGLSHAALGDLIAQQAAAGLRPAVIEMYRAGNETRFAAIFEKRASGDWNVGIELSPGESQAKFETMKSQGFRPVRISVCLTADGLRFTEIFEKAGGKPWASKAGLSAGEVIRLTDENRAKGMNLADVSIYNDGNGIHYAAIWAQ